MAAHSTPDQGTAQAAARAVLGHPCGDLLLGGHEPCCSAAATGAKVQSNAEIRMLNPYLQGRTEKGKPYLVTAASAVRDNADTAKLTLEQPVLNLGAGGPEWTRIHAAHGVYREDNGPSGPARPGHARRLQGQPPGHRARLRRHQEEQCRRRDAHRRPGPPWRDRRFVLFAAERRLLCTLRGACEVAYRTSFDVLAEGYGSRLAGPAGAAAAVK
ncbi:MAG: hypothetical protein WDN45_06680 [Caulobacteraceae bacterium]